MMYPAYDPPPPPHPYTVQYKGGLKRPTMLITTQ